jgi:hypothetical protein
MTKVYGTPNIEEIRRVAMQIVRELEEKELWTLQKKSS